MQISNKRMAASWLAKQTNLMKKYADRHVETNQITEREEFCLVNGEKWKGTKEQLIGEFIRVETHKPYHYDILVYACDVPGFAKYLSVRIKDLVIW